MGCVVNGPGEAREADLGIAAGNKRGHLFVKGRNVAVVPESEMVEALVDWATFIHEHGAEAAIARVDTALAEREAAKDRNGPAPNKPLLVLGILDLVEAGLVGMDGLVHKDAQLNLRFKFY
jgi:hypothetical protein